LTNICGSDASDGDDNNGGDDTRARQGVQLPALVRLRM